MPILRQKLAYKKSLEYLLISLESVERRRTAVENKSSILLAANAIILASMLSLGFPNIATIFSYLDLIRIILMSITLGSVIFSILFCSGVLGGHINDRMRGKIMDIKNEHNVFYFGKIAELSKKEYLVQLEKLTEKQILEQIGGDIHNVARLTRDRYKHFNSANKFFVISVISFATLAIAQLIN